MSTQQAEPSGRPGRYQRSAAGLVVSLVVTVVGIGALLYFMGAFRPDFEVKPDRVDYLETVASAQEAGLEPVYPRVLPEGWIATGVEVVPGDGSTFMVRMLTDDERFVAVRQEEASPLTLARRWIDEDAETADDHTVPADVADPVARQWKGFADDGGDAAYAAEVGGQTLIVFGSAPVEDLQELITLLVTDPVG